MTSAAYLLSPDPGLTTFPSPRSDAKDGRHAQSLGSAHGLCPSPGSVLTAGVTLDKLPNLSVSPSLTSKLGLRTVPAPELS